MISRFGHALLWAFTFPATGFLIWCLLFGVAGGIVKDGGPGRLKVAGDLEGFRVLTGMLLVLILGAGGGVGGWLWPAVGTFGALGYVALGVAGTALVTGVLLWIFGVPHLSLV